MFDVLIINGNLVDGTGNKASKVDIGIIADKINQIGNLKDASAKKIIDGNGKTISPGFIDTHAHSDAALLIDPIHENGIRQGITTEILGQDGLSYAPLSKENYLFRYSNITLPLFSKKIYLPLHLSNQLHTLIYLSFLLLNLKWMYWLDLYKRNDLLLNTISH